MLRTRSDSCVLSPLSSLTISLYLCITISLHNEKERRVRFMSFDFEAGERAGADLPDPTACFPPGSMQPEASTFPASTLHSDRTRRSEPAQNTEDVLALFYEPCPQGDDCAGDGKHRRLFDCSEGCGFRGC